MKKLLSLTLTFLMLFAIVPLSAIADESENLGDINGNGIIDMTDYILLKRAYFGTYTFTDAQNKAGDINGNGKIDMTDYILLKRIYFGTYKIGDDVIDTNENKTPSQEDIDTFYSMLESSWMVWLNHSKTENVIFKELDANSLFWSYIFYEGKNIGIHYALGFKLDIIDEDPEYRYDFLEEGLCDGVYVADVSEINWVAENVFDVKLDNLEIYDAYSVGNNLYWPNWNLGGLGYDFISIDGTYEALNNGSYKFNVEMVYGAEDGLVNCIYEYEFVAMLRYDENIGAYWNLISCQMINHKEIDLFL